MSHRILAVPASLEATGPDRMAGTCVAETEELFDDTWEYRLNFDLQVLDLCEAIALPPGGDDQGETLMTCYAAMQVKDYEALKPCAPVEVVDPETDRDWLSRVSG